MILAKQGRGFQKVNLLHQLRVLIIRPDRIGDVVLSTPLPKAVKAAFPDAYVAVMVSDYTKDIYKHNPFVDDVLVTRGNFLAELREVRKHRFTHAFMLLPNQFHNYLLFAAGIWTRVGVGHKLYQVVTNTKAVYRNKYSDRRSEADYCLDMVRKIGIEVDDVSTSLYLSPEEERSAAHLKQELLDGGEKLVGIHTTSGNSAPNMPPAEYAVLLRALAERNDIRVAVTDTQIPREVEGIDGVLYLNRGFSLRAAIVNFSMLDLLVSASTGPMHIAAGLKVPTLSLFCPLPACEPALWGPQGNAAKYILPEAGYCSNKCPGDPKKCSFAGDGGIGAEKVLRNIDSTVKQLNRLPNRVLNRG